MVLKIEKDHQRFRQIVKGRIREDLRKFLTKGELIGKEGKHLISCERMVDKLRAAVAARRSPAFVIIARTDALAVDGWDDAVSRARAYEAAGADVIFPEALTSREQVEAFRKVVEVPLLANMTEFGKSPWISDDDFARIGYQLVLHPVTTFRLAARAVRDALAEMKTTGNQQSLVDAGRLMPRGEIDSFLVAKDGI